MANEEHLDDDLEIFVQNGEYLLIRSNIRPELNQTHRKRE